MNHIKTYAEFLLEKDNEDLVKNNLQEPLDNKDDSEDKENQISSSDDKKIDAILKGYRSDKEKEESGESDEEETEEESDDIDNSGGEDVEPDNK